MEEIYTGPLSLRPSFSNGIFLIHNPTHEIYQYELRDIHGKSFFIDKNNSSNSESLDLTAFPNGMYIVSFFIEGKYLQEKFVKF
ncbi:MAG: T9SS type A sorting domain-containing protein [Saprospiraceae bacterium]|nr:T9SS type A sorting domain-containing protein [Saprospiraceae bacterium]